MNKQQFTFTSVKVLPLNLNSIKALLMTVLLVVVLFDFRKVNTSNKYYQNSVIILHSHWVD